MWPKGKPGHWGGKKRPKHSKWMKENNPSKCPEVRAKLRKEKLGEKNPMFGKKNPSCRGFKDPVVSKRKNIEKAKMERLKSIFGNRCWYCGSTQTYHIGGGYGSEMQKEHIVPSSGKKQDCGKFEDADALACGNCNRAKLDQSVSEFLKWLAYVRSSKFQCLILSKLPKFVVDELEDYEWDLLAKD
jgi:hypothetical protein